MTVDLVEWSWGGHHGRIHPLAFVASLWRMEGCPDGYTRPQVCDPSVPHPATNEDDGLMIEPWQAA